MTLEEVRAFLATEFEQVFGADYGMVLDRAEAGEARVRLTPALRHLRPGGIVSGPTLMTSADAAGYAALLSLDENARMAVTTNLSINFLRAASAEADLVADCRLIKGGRRLAVLECEARSEGSREIVAHTVMTYAMPPR